MRIVFVTSEFIDFNSLLTIDGGLANYLHNITRTLCQMGHNVSVIVAHQNINKTILYNGIRVIFLNHRSKRSFLQKLIWPFIPSRKRKIIKINLLYASISKCIQNLSKKQKIDFIQYASCLCIGRYPEKEIPSCLRISSYAKTHQKCYDSYNAEELKLEQEQYINAPYLFGPSKHIAEFIKKDLHLEKDIKIIESPYPESIDNEDDFDDSVLNDLKSKIKNAPYLLFFGSIGRLKGCGVIADCIYDILAKYPHIYLVIVGKSIIINNIDYANLIKNKAKEFSNRIIRYPSIPHTQLYPVIKNAMGIIMPSLTENFSNACVEAMRLRKIVIGTEGNFSQLLTDRVNGFLSKSGDSESLKEKIIELISLMPKQKKEMETKSFERTRSLSPENICNQLLDYYQYIIKHWEVKNG